MTRTFVIAAIGLAACSETSSGERDLIVIAPPCAVDAGALPPVPSVCVVVDKSGTAVAAGAWCYPGDVRHPTSHSVDSSCEQCPASFLREAKTLAGLRVCALPVGFCVNSCSLCAPHGWGKDGIRCCPSESTDAGVVAHCP